MSEEVGWIGDGEPTAEIGPDDAMETAPGARFGRFIVLGALGSGGMGIVLSALDPELDRRVALKLLRSELGDRARIGSLLQLEAQAMARLAHPNAVAVYEVGRVDDQPFIAMELVDGITLRAWLAQRSHGWRETVAMFVAAGRGLAAAHAVGLTHRDFKPGNVLIGNDGRPRVGDFGLATRRLDHSVELIAPARLDASATLAGVPVGTPAFMAPEQWRGETTDARSDQFAFAVALWSALYDERPFGGDDCVSLRTAVLAGVLVRPARSSHAPRWLSRILERALALDPDHRWPTLTTLLDRIEKRAARRRAPLVLAAGVIGVGLAIALAIGSRGVADPCPPPDASSLWDPMRRAVVALHAAAIDPETGAQRFQAAERAVDSGFAIYEDMHGAACRATRVEGTQSDHLLDLRMRCLNDWLVSGRKLIAGLADATTSAALESAVHMVGALPGLDRCADVRALEATTEPPAKPSDRVISDEILAEIKTMSAALRAGQPGLAPKADALVRRARTLGHPFTLSRALGLRWRIASSSDQDTQTAVTVLREQIEVAARAHDDEEAAKAWSFLLMLVGFYQGHATEAKALFPAARAAAARAGDPPDVLVSILDNESTVLMEHGEYTAALAKITEARHVLDRAQAQRPGASYARRLAELAQSAGVAQRAAGQLDAGEASLRESLAGFARLYGPDTGVEASAVQLDLAQLLRMKGALADAELAARASVRIRARGGDTPAVALAQSVLSVILADRGKIDEAVVLGDRAVERARATMPADDATLAELIKNLAEVRAAAGHVTQALALYDEVVATYARAGVTSGNAIEALIGRAELLRRLGRCTAALADYRAAADFGIRLEGDTSAAAGRAMRGEGVCLAQLGRSREAIAALERGLATPMPGTEADRAEVARGVLGRLLVVTGGDRLRGLARVRAAVARLHALHSTDPVVAMLETWLASR